LGDALFAAGGFRAGQFFQQFYVFGFEFHEREVVFLPEFLALALPALLDLLQQPVFLPALGQLFGESFVLILGLSVGGELCGDVLFLFFADAFECLVLSFEALHGSLHVLVDLVAGGVPFCEFAPADHHFLLQVEVHLLQIANPCGELAVFLCHRLVHHLHFQQSLLLALQLTHCVALRLHRRSEVADLLLPPSQLTLEFAGAMFELL